MDMTEWLREHSWVLAPAFIVTLAIIIWIKAKLSKMSGFVSVDMAVNADADKKRVLEQMEQQDLDWLPVVQQDNGVNHFQGIVERSRLTASLILDVTNQLENKKKEQEK